MPLAAPFMKTLMILLGTVKLFPILLLLAVLAVLALTLLVIGAFQKKRVLPNDYWDRC